MPSVAWTRPLGGRVDGEEGTQPGEEGVWEELSLVVLPEGVLEKYVLDVFEELELLLLLLLLLVLAN